MSYITDAIRELIPNASWSLTKPEPTTEEEFNNKFQIVTGYNEHRDAIFSNDTSDFGITWAQVQTKATELENAEPLSLLRESRNMKLKQTDWWASSDLTMTAEQTAYRQALRDITDTYSSMDDEGFSWPTKP